MFLPAGSVFADSGISDGSNNDVVLNELHGWNLSLPGESWQLCQAFIYDYSNYLLWESRGYSRCDWESPAACVNKILQEHVITAFEEILSVTQDEVSKGVMKEIKIAEAKWDWRTWSERWYLTLFLHWENDMNRLISSKCAVVALLTENVLILLLQLFVQTVQLVSKLLELLL